MKPSTWIIALSFLVLLNTFFFYGFVRDGTWVVLALLSWPLYKKIGAPNFILLSFSFLLVTLVLVAAVHFGLRDRLYYRPYEMLNTVDWDGLSIFKKNETVDMMQPHGDIRAIAGDTGDFETVPRRIVFQVDSLGFRNEHDYHGQKFVLVGDSFIAGNGNSQENILSSQLKTRHGVDTYNLGIPGGVRDYLNNIDKLEKHTGGQDFKAILFLYEGNDFPIASKVDKISGVERFKNAYKKYLNIYKSLFRRTDLYRFTYLSYVSLTQKVKGKNPAWSRQVGQRRVGFLSDPKSFEIKNYPKPYFEERLLAMKGRIAALVFIPTKMKVYESLMEPPLEKPLGNPFGAYTKDLAQRAGLPYLDLTPTLVAVSKKLLEEKNTLTYWPDDTHWNGHGIATAAHKLCHTIPDLNCTGN